MSRFSVLLLTAVLAACSRPANNETAEEKLGVAAPSVGRAAAIAAPEAVSAAPKSSAFALADSLLSPMLVRNGFARVEVGSLEPAVAAVQQLAQRLGGHVAGVTTQTGRERIREASLTLRIPAPRFDEALSGLEPLGKVESISVTSEDVGEEYVDIGVRLQNGRRLEQRLLELLQTRTGKLEEVLAVERELARVREEIERYEGRLRYLRSRAAASTLTITLYEPVPLLSDYQGRNVLLRSFGQAWRNFVNLVAGFIGFLGIVLPVGLALVIGWLFFRRRK